jgi:tetratricopeptide (TPR) repeat protein
MSRKRKRSFFGEPAGSGFGAACGRAGYLAVTGQRARALALIKESLSKYRGRAQQYQLLCQGGDALLGEGKVDDALKIFKEALGAAYEPAAGKARVGLAKCYLLKGDHGKAREAIDLAIDEAGKAAKEGYSRDSEGVWTLLAVPLCPQAIAMRIYRSFFEAGRGGMGVGVLERAARRAVGNAFRLDVFRGRVDEDAGRREAALKRYDGALAGASLGPRALPALAGWCRCASYKDLAVLRQKLSGFRGKLSDRAILTAALNLRSRGRGAWTDMARAELTGGDGVAAAAVLPLRIMLLGNRRRWDGMLGASEKFLEIPGLSPQEIAGGVAAGVEARWQMRGGDGGVEEAARNVRDRAAARWAGYRRLLALGDGAGCEGFFRKFGKSSPAAMASLGKALLAQDKFQEAAGIFAGLARQERAPVRCRGSAIVSLVEAEGRRKEGVSGATIDLFRSYVDGLAEDGGTMAVAGLASMAVGLRRVRGGKDLAEEALARARRAFDGAFFSCVEARDALIILNAMNEAIATFGGRGGIRDLYLSSAKECHDLIAGGGSHFYQYMVSVYEDTFGLGLVSEAAALWDEVRGRGRIPSKWRGARFLAEAEIRVNNLQASGMDLAASAYSTFGTGKFAARACYLLALDRMGKGGDGAAWAVAGLDALGSAKGEEGNLGLTARLEVLGVNFDRRKLGKLELRWRRRMSFQTVAERVLRDLSRAEAPTSA